MLDFLIDNPFIVIILIYGLVSLLSGKKKRQEKALRKAQAFADKAAQAKKDPAERENYRSKIEDVLRNAIEQADREFSGAKPAASTTKPATARPAVSTATSSAGSIAQSSSSSDDPFAFHSLMHGESANRVERADYDQTAKDYDIVGVDYDQTGKDYDRKTEAFTYHSAIEEPVEKEYHLTSFPGFQSAHALSIEDRRKLEAADASGAQGGKPLWSTPDDLRRAFIMQEVLGSPKARRA